MSSHLSQAEIEQRRAAARSRWDKAKQAGATVAGAATAGALGHQLATQLQARRKAERISAASERLHDVADRRTAQWKQMRLSRIERAVGVRSENVAGPFNQSVPQNDPQVPTKRKPKALNPVSRRVRMIRRELGSTPSEMGRIKAQLAQNELDWSMSGAEERAATQRLKDLESRSGPLLEEKAHLESASPAKRVDRKGHTRTRRVSEWDREVVEDVKDGFIGRKNRRRIQMQGRVGASHWVRETRVKVPGDISPKGMATIRRNLRQQAEQIGLRAAAHAETMRPRIKPRAIGEISGRYLRMLDHRMPRRFRLAAAGAAALAGGAAGYLATRRVEKLAKASPEPGDRILGAADRVEGTMAERLAATFRRWTDNLAGSLTSPGSSQNVLGQMSGDLAEAISPVDDAAKAGASISVPMTPLSDPGSDRQVTFSFDGRNPETERFILDYRMNRVRELTEQQIQALRSVVWLGALEGLGPDAMARLVRETIGLTKEQALHVVSYRKELETLDPRAIHRALRDGRYDRGLRRALENGEPLSAERIDRMVDAYHRRYLAYRAMTISRTEGLRAANAGHVQSVREYLTQNQNLTVIKTWIATKDNRTRDSHRDLDGQQVIGLDTPFITSRGTYIRWPHDENCKDAGEIVNCRCTQSLRLVPRDRAASMGFTSL